MSKLSANDRIGRQKMTVPAIPELEGRVKVQLFNAETGELKKEVEGHNIVTNVIRDIFAANGLGAMDYQSLLPIYKKMFGGILCFRDQLTEDADNYYLPNLTSNPIIAHAGRDSTSQEEQADSTMGHPTAESSPVTGGYKYVWEFGTTQGNGPISSLAMCPPDLGRYAMAGSRFNPVIAPGAVDSTQRSDGNTSVFPQIWDDENHCAYAVIYSAASSVVIRKYTAFGSMDNIGFMQEKITTLYNEVANQYEDHTFTISNAGRSKVFWIDGDIVIMVPNATTIDKHVIDVSDWTMTDSTLSPDLDGGQLSVRENLWNDWWTDASSGWPCTVYCELDEDGYFYMVNSTLMGVYKIKYDDISRVSLIAGSATCWSLGQMGYFCLGKWACFLYSQNYLAVTDGTTWWSGFPTGLTGTTHGNLHLFASLLGCNKSNNSPVRTYSQYIDIVGNQSKQSIGYIRSLPYILFMSTIKNLPETTTKTATDNMVITYTITEVESNNT